MRLLAAILAGILLAANLPAANLPAAEKPAKDTAVFEGREALAKLQAMDIFPEMEKEGSEFSNAISEEVKRLEAEEPSFFKSPAWPIRAANRIAAKLGVKGRTVAEIRAHLAKTFALDAAAFRQIHGVQVVSARLTVAGETIDVTPQLATLVNDEGLAVDCDAALVATLADETQFERNPEESKVDYWKRQRKLLAAVASPQGGALTLQITYEFHSEQPTASAKEGERLVISADGVATVAKIAPAAKPVRATDGLSASAKSKISPAKTAGKSPEKTEPKKR